MCSVFIWSFITYDKAHTYPHRTRAKIPLNLKYYLSEYWISFQLKKKITPDYTHRFCQSIFSLWKKRNHQQQHYRKKKWQMYQQVKRVSFFFIHRWLCHMALQCVFKFACHRYKRTLVSSKLYSLDCVLLGGFGTEEDRKQQKQSIPKAMTSIHGNCQHESNP